MHPASSGAGRASATAYSPLTYPLDEAKVRNVASIMRVWDPRGPRPTSEDPAELAAYMAKVNAGADFVNKVGSELVSHDTTVALEAVPELKTAIATAGLTPREFARALLAYTNAQGALGMEGLDALTGEKSSTTHTGVFKDNIELIRRMNRDQTLPNW